MINFLPFTKKNWIQNTRNLINYTTAQLLEMCTLDIIQFAYIHIFGGKKTKKNVKTFPSLTLDQFCRMPHLGVFLNNLKIKDLTILTKVFCLSALNLKVGCFSCVNSYYTI